MINRAIDLNFENLLHELKLSECLFISQEMSSKPSREIESINSGPITLIKSNLFSTQIERPQQKSYKEEKETQFLKQLFKHRCHELLAQLLQNSYANPTASRALTGQLMELSTPNSLTHAVAGRLSRSELKTLIQAQTGAISVELIENQPQEKTIDKHLLNRLGGDNHQLGVNSLLGKRFIDNQQGLAIHLNFNSAKKRNAAFQERSKILQLFIGQSLKIMMRFKLLVPSRLVLGKVELISSIF